MEAGFLGVLADVSPEAFKGSAVADEVVEAFVLPESAAAAGQLVDLTRSMALPRSGDAADRMVRGRGEEGVDVIRHDRVVAELIALAVEVVKGAFDDGGMRRMAQEAGPVTGVEKVVELLAEAAEIGAAVGLVELREDVGEIAGGGGEAVKQPDAAFVVPGVEGFGRDGVGEAEGDEGNGLGLLPVGEAAAVVRDVLLGIVEHRGRMGCWGEFTR